MRGDELRAGTECEPDGGGGATVSLVGEVMRRIEAEGVISFREYCEVVLYHPKWGYYACSERQRTGREGDFFTSVSVGPLFGKLLCEHLRAIWQEMGEPESFRVVEWGAENGQLALDILEAAHESGWNLNYAIVEPLPEKRVNLGRLLEGRVEVVSASDELAPKPGVVIANELIDALPFWLVRFQGGRWQEKVVGKTGDGALGWELREITGELEARLAKLGTNFSEGYETELRPSCTTLLDEMAGTLERGEVVLLDYGFEREDYYCPERKTGTLRTYGRHRSGEDPLKNLGEWDITAHVDWTSLQEDAEEMELEVLSFEKQGSFLTKAGTSWLQAREGQVDKKVFAQFQTLTHPAQMGAKFWVMRVGSQSSKMT